MDPNILLGTLFSNRSRDSDWLRAGRSSPGSVKNYLFSTLSTPALRSTQPPIQQVPGALSPGVKRPGREANHSPPDSTEVKKMWIYTSILSTWSTLLFFLPYSRTPNVRDKVLYPYKTNNVSASETNEHQSHCLCHT
jgi:hypothetical protein